MTEKTNKKDEALCVSIKDDMTIYNSQSLKETLLSYCHSGTQELQLDLSAVTEIDSAGLQLLLLLKAEAQKRGFTLRLVQHSEAVIEVFELLKLGMYFGDPIVIPANWTKS
ncbi:STAS domain-containing protein [Methylobacter sp.]|uniref:STAS domain-containing protein n=1 Tax=Methylobacter sp. TaxID=2051955 RepID=UPI002FDECADC